MTDTLMHLTRGEKSASVEPYHYTMCGLDNIYLSNGFRHEESPYGRVIIIEHMDGLHKAIGLVLVRQKKYLSGREFRYLRKALRLSQSKLALLLSVSGQTVARWEKEQTVMNPAAERLLRGLYLASIGKNEPLHKLLKLLSEIDEIEEKLTFTDKDGRWRLEEAA